MAYLQRTGNRLGEITAFIKPLKPDIIGLVEVDAGSYRSHRRNQAQVMADSLGHYHSYRSKYGEVSFIGRLPVLNKQGNAFLARDTIRNAVFHYFDRGVKRLVIELELENLTLFLVHLSLAFRIRHRQLSDLYSLVKDRTRPLIVAGDFNALWGDQEVRLFLAATGLASAAPSPTPTFPSWSPRRELDFILHSPEICVTHFAALPATYSDHLPLLCDFEINGAC